MHGIKPRFSLVTYNIHKGFGLGKVRFLLPEMREALQQLNPDFVFLQEAQGEHRGREKRIEAWPDTPQVEYIAENAWPYYIYAKNAVYHSGHHGNAILSKFAFEQFENFNLSHINRASRGVLHSQLILNDTERTKIHLLCVHLGLFKAERAEQCEALMLRITDAIPKHEPLLMAGDFNDWQMLLSKPLLEALEINEAFFSTEGHHARSFPAIKPALCMDRIYYRGLTICGVECLQGKPWRTLSDHVPLYAQFSVNP